jgi:hypothetical protein
MITRINIRKHVSELIEAIKESLDLVPSLVLIPMILKGIDSGKTDLVIKFILVYVSLEILVRLSSRLIATKRQKNASKITRVFELSEKGLVIYQIADILEKEGYKSILGRKILEQSIGKIIEKGNRRTVLELNPHKISKSILWLIIRFIMVIAFLVIIYSPIPNVIINDVIPDVSGPQPIGTNINYTVQIYNKNIIKFKYEILVDDERIPNNDDKLGDFSFSLNTTGKEEGNHGIEVRVWPSDNNAGKENMKVWKGSFKLYNRKPEINKFSSYFYQDDLIKTDNSATIGTIVHFKVQATDPEHDNLSYKFAVDGIYAVPQPNDAWDWDTSKYKEGIHEIGVTVTDEKPHSDALDINN